MHSQARGQAEGLRYIAQFPLTHFNAGAINAFGLTALLRSNQANQKALERLMYNTKD